VSAERYFKVLMMLAFLSGGFVVAISNGHPETLPRFIIGSSAGWLFAEVSLYIQRRRQS